MNFERGMRRIGFVLALCGGLAGIGISVLAGSDLWSRRSQANKWVVAEAEGRTTHLSRESGPEFVIWSRKIEKGDTLHIPQYGEPESTNPNLGVVESFYSEPKRPELYEYLLLPLGPVFGFALPWLVVWTFTWVVSGFFRDKPSH